MLSLCLRRDSHPPSISRSFRPFFRRVTGSRAFGGVIWSIKTVGASQVATHAKSSMGMRASVIFRRTPRSITPAKGSVFMSVRAGFQKTSFRISLGLKDDRASLCRIAFITIHTIICTLYSILGVLKSSRKENMLFLRGNDIIFLISLLIADPTIACYSLPVVRKVSGG